MKNTFIKFICLTLVFLTLLFCVVGCKDTPAAANESESVNYLVLGLDDAAQNSDIIMLVGCRGAEITFLQIPRDTYFAYGGGQNKINGLFASHKASAGKNKDALSLLSLELSDVLGVDIQAAFALTIPAFLSFVDEIGGVKINMPFDFSYTDEHGTGEVKLSAGENLLNAAQSERFVRYRLGYALGDLSRIDAQKIFFRGLVGTVTDTPFYKLCRGAFAARDSIYTDAGFSDILTILKNKPKKTDKLIYRFITLPGEAVVSGGISYYSVNSKNARCVLKKYFSSRGFDSEGAMLRRDEVAFYNVYYDENASYREYDDGNFGDIKLK